MAASSQKEGEREDFGSKAAAHLFLSKGIGILGDVRNEAKMHQKKIEEVLVMITKVAEVAREEDEKMARVQLDVAIHNLLELQESMTDAGRFSLKPVEEVLGKLTFHHLT